MQPSALADLDGALRQSHHNSSLPTEEVVLSILSMRIGSPLYATLRDDLQRQITSGRLVVGSWLPSEAELQRQYGISQSPVRRALRDLEQLGLISRHQGRGSVVRSRELSAANRMIGLGTELRERGHVVESVSLEPARLETAPDHVCRELELAEGSVAYRLHRMFLVDGEPCVVFIHFLSPAIGEGLGDDLDRASSLYQFLSSRGFGPTGARETISAGTLTGAQAAELDLAAGSVALIRHRVAFTADWTPVESTTYWARADRYSMNLDIHDPSQG